MAKAAGGETFERQDKRFGIISQSLSLTSSFVGPPGSRPVQCRSREIVFGALLNFNFLPRSARAGRERWELPIVDLRAKSIPSPRPFVRLEGALESGSIGQPARVTEWASHLLPEGVEKEEEASD